MAFRTYKYNDFNLNREEILTSKVEIVNVDLDTNTGSRGYVGGEKLINQIPRAKTITWQGAIVGGSRTATEELLDDMKRNLLFVGEKDFVMEFAGEERSISVFVDNFEVSDVTPTKDIYEITLTFQTGKNPAFRGPEEEEAFTLNSESNTLQVTFNGSAPPRMDIRVDNNGDDTWDSVTITNVTNNKSAQWDDTVKSDENLLFDDFEPIITKIDDVGDKELFPMKGVPPKGLKGQNTYQIDIEVADGDTVDGEIKFTYQPRYL